MSRIPFFVPGLSTCRAVSVPFPEIRAFLRVPWQLDDLGGLPAASTGRHESWDTDFAERHGYA
jgi:hypothetical protein